jgi:hypothetical protein
VPVTELAHKIGTVPKIVYCIRVKRTESILRKIETQMNDAITNNVNWQSGNTSVHFEEETGISVVRLHGNKIAEVGDTFIRLFDGGFQSVTTKSRLNAILEEHGEKGDRVFQKAFDWFVQMNTVQGLTTVPFFSSMRLG